MPVKLNRLPTIVGAALMIPFMFYPTGVVEANQAGTAEAMAAATEATLYTIALLFVPGVALMLAGSMLKDEVVERASHYTLVLIQPWVLFKMAFIAGLLAHNVHAAAFVSTMLIVVATSCALILWSGVIMFMKDKTARQF